jgi:RNA polymerase sigma factor (sigma-70 family)
VRDGKEVLEAPSDRELMLAVREGAVAQLGILFERHHTQLFNFLLRMTGSRSISEDLVQEVFVRLLKYRHTYRGESEFTTWMFSIARNARIDYLRRSPRDTSSVEDEAHETASAVPSSAELMIRDEESRLLWQAVSRLPEDKREILLLRGVHEMKFEEIAKMLNCPVNTIKGRAFRAIRELRAMVRQPAVEGTL